MSTLHQHTRPRGQIPMCFHTKHVWLNPSTCACACGKNQISTQSWRAADTAGVNQPTDKEQQRDDESISFVRVWERANGHKNNFPSE